MEEKCGVREAKLVSFALLEVKSEGVWELRLCLGRMNGNIGHCFVEMDRI